MNKLVSVLCALSNDCPIINWVPKLYRVLLFDEDEDKPRHCNLASVLYDHDDSGLLFPISAGLLYHLHETSQRKVVRVWNGYTVCSFFPPCFRENVVVTCKIGSSFLCSLDNLLQKNVIVFFFGNQILKWRSFKKKKGGYFWPTFHIFQSPGKSYKKSFSTYLTPIHTCILLILLTFFALPIKKKIRTYQYGFSLVWVLVLILICAILEQSINNKMVSKI